MWLVLGLLLGAGLAWWIRPEVSQDAARYVAIVVIAALDASIGGIRSWQERTYRDRIFLTSLLVNAAAAIGLIWIGDRLAVDILNALVVVFGIRIFQNIAAIRRKVFGG